MEAHGRLLVMHTAEEYGGEGVQHPGRAPSARGRAGAVAVAGAALGGDGAGSGDALARRPADVRRGRRLRLRRRRRDPGAGRLGPRRPLRAGCRHPVHRDDDPRLRPLAAGGAPLLPRRSHVPQRPRRRWRGNARTPSTASPTTGAPSSPPGSRAPASADGARRGLPPAGGPAPLRRFRAPGVGLGTSGASTTPGPGST